MRIEILIGNSEEPLIYPLNKPKLSVGSAETCDIIVDAPNVSRKHVQILSEGDAFYVVDQGSTNGTFINEERLVPGRRTEFTSFFPVRLGDSVLITLLSDEEAPADEPPSLSFPEPEKTPAAGLGRSSDESTKMISLRDLQKAKTSDLVNRRQEIVKKKKTVAPAGKAGAKTAKPKSKRTQEKNRMLRIQLFVLLFIGAAAYINFFVIEKSGDKKVAKIGEEIPLENKAKPVVEEKPPEPVFVVPESELPPKEKVQGLLSDIKCTLDIEKYFCEKVYKNGEVPFGTVQVGATMFILSDGEPYYEEAKRFLPLPPTSSETGQYTPEEIATYEKGVREVMAAIYLLRAMPKDFDQEKIKDLKLTIGLFRKDTEGQYKVEAVISVLPPSLVEFHRLFEETHLVNVTKIGTSAIEFVKKYYRVY